MRIALLVPHIFMDKRYLNGVIFSPGTIAIDLANALADLNHEVTLFSPGNIDGNFTNINADTSLIDIELESRGYDLKTLMSKHPLTYITLSRQIQTQLISKAYEMANAGNFDLVHVWINEEDVALEFAKFCNKPIVFTHHEPFNFLTRYRTSFARYKDLNWISISNSQRKTIGTNMNWIGNVYHGLPDPMEQYEIIKTNEYKKYFAYLGRIIEPKGVHHAIKAVLEFNKGTNEIIPLKIAGKHYSDSSQDSYWKKEIEPHIDNKIIQSVGFISDPLEKYNFLYNAKALIVPSTWEEPFGMISIEANSVGTYIIGSNFGATKEIIKDGINGYIYNGLLPDLSSPELDSEKVKEYYKNNFSIEKMAENYSQIYQNLQ